MDLTNNGKCSRCGQCCSNFLPLTKDEIVHLRQLAKKEDTIAQIKYIPDGRVMMLCPFLIANNETETTRCSIYNDRPSVCRLYKCNKDRKVSAKESMKYRIVDMMKEIVEFDYRKINNMTYEEAMAFHLKLCAEGDKE